MNDCTVESNTQEDRLVRISTNQCTNCSEPLIEACRWARTAISDSITFVVYIAEKIKDEHQVEYCNEARHVLVENLTKAIDGLDNAMAASNCAE